MNEFSIKSSLHGKVAVVAIVGRVDSATAPTMDAELEKTVSENKKIVLDLQAVEYMSSAGVRAIVKALPASGELAPIASSTRTDI